MMMSARKFSSGNVLEIRPWIVDFLMSSNPRVTAQKLHVLRYLSGPDEDGSILKEGTDLHVTVSVRFTANALAVFRGHQDSESPDTHEEFNRSFIILRKYGAAHRPRTSRVQSCFELVVDDFSMWANETGLRLKVDPQFCMEIAEVRFKSDQLWEEWRQKSLQQGEQSSEEEETENAAESMTSLCLTQLVDCVAADFPPKSQDPPPGTTQTEVRPVDRVMEDSGKVRGGAFRQPMQIIRLGSPDLPIRLAPTVNLSLLRVSADQQEQLDAIPDWKADFRPTIMPYVSSPSRSLSSSRNSPMALQAESLPRLGATRISPVSAQSATNHIPNRITESEDNNSSFTVLGTLTYMDTPTRRQSSEGAPTTLRRSSGGVNMSVQVGDSVINTSPVPKQVGDQRTDMAAQVGDSLLNPADSQYQSQGQRDVHSQCTLEPHTENSDAGTNNTRGGNNPARTFSTGASTEEAKRLSQNEPCSSSSHQSSKDVSSEETVLDMADGADSADQIIDTQGQRMETSGEVSSSGQSKSDKSANSRHRSDSISRMYSQAPKQKDSQSASEVDARSQVSDLVSDVGDYAEQVELSCSESADSEASDNSPCQESHVSSSRSDSADGPVVVSTLETRSRSAQKKLDSGPRRSPRGMPVEKGPEPARKSPRPNHRVTETGMPKESPRTSTLLKNVLITNQKANILRPSEDASGHSQGQKGQSKVNQNSDNTSENNPQKKIEDFTDDSPAVRRSSPRLVSYSSSESSESQSQNQGAEASTGSRRSPRFNEQRVMSSTDLGASPRLRNQSVEKGNSLRHAANSHTNSPASSRNSPRFISENQVNKTNSNSSPRCIHKTTEALSDTRSSPRSINKTTEALTDTRSSARFTSKTIEAVTDTRSSPHNINNIAEVLGESRNSPHSMNKTTDVLADTRSSPRFTNKITETLADSRSSPRSINKTTEVLGETRNCPRSVDKTREVLAEARSSPRFINKTIKAITDARSSPRSINKTTEVFTDSRSSPRFTSKTIEAITNARSSPRSINKTTEVLPVTRSSQCSANKITEVLADTRSYPRFTNKTVETLASIRNSPRSSNKDDSKVPQRSPHLSHRTSEHLTEARYLASLGNMERSDENSTDSRRSPRFVQQDAEKGADRGVFKQAPLTSLPAESHSDDIVLPTPPKMRRVYRLTTQASSKGTVRKEHEKSVDQTNSTVNGTPEVGVILNQPKEVSVSPVAKVLSVRLKKYDSLESLQNVVKVKQHTDRKTADNSPVPMNSDKERSVGSERLLYPSSLATARRPLRSASNQSPKAVERGPAVAPKSSPDKPESVSPSRPDTPSFGTVEDTPAQSSPKDSPFRDSEEHPDTTLHTPYVVLKRLRSLSSDETPVLRSTGKVPSHSTQNSATPQSRNSENMPVLRSGGKVPSHLTQISTTPQSQNNEETSVLRSAGKVPSSLVKVSPTPQTQNNGNTPVLRSTGKEPYHSTQLSPTASKLPPPPLDLDVSPVQSHNSENTPVLRSMGKASSHSAQISPALRSQNNEKTSVLRSAGKVPTNSTQTSPTPQTQNNGTTPVLRSTGKVPSRSTQNSSAPQSQNNENTPVLRSAGKVPSRSTQNSTTPQSQNNENTPVLRSAGKVPYHSTQISPAASKLPPPPLDLDVSPVQSQSNSAAKSSLERRRTRSLGSAKTLQDHMEPSLLKETPTSQGNKHTQQSPTRNAGQIVTEKLSTVSPSKDVPVATSVVVLQRLECAGDALYQSTQVSPERCAGPPHRAPDLSPIRVASTQREQELQPPAKKHTRSLSLKRNKQSPYQEDKHISANNEVKEKPLTELVPLVVLERIDSDPERFRKLKYSSGDSEVSSDYQRHLSHSLSSSRVTDPGRHVIPTVCGSSSEVSVLSPIRRIRRKVSAARKTSQLSSSSGDDAGMSHGLYIKHREGSTQDRQGTSLKKQPTQQSDYEGGDDSGGFDTSSIQEEVKSTRKSLRNNTLEERPQTKRSDRQGGTPDTSNDRAKGDSTEEEGIRARSVRTRSQPIQYTDTEGQTDTDGENVIVIDGSPSPLAASLNSRKGRNGSVRSKHTASDTKSQKDGGTSDQSGLGECENAEDHVSPSLKPRTRRNSNKVTNMTEDDSEAGTPPSRQQRRTRSVSSSTEVQDPQQMKGEGNEEKTPTRRSARLGRSVHTEGESSEDDEERTVRRRVKTNRPRALRPRLPDNSEISSVSDYDTVSLPGNYSDGRIGRKSRKGGSRKEEGSDEEYLPPRLPKTPLGRVRHLSSRSLSSDSDFMSPPGRSRKRALRAQSRSIKKDESASKQTSQRKDKKDEQEDPTLLDSFLNATAGPRNKAKKTKKQKCLVTKESGKFEIIDENVVSHDVNVLFGNSAKKRREPGLNTTSAKKRRLFSDRKMLGDPMMEIQEESSRLEEEPSGTTPLKPIRSAKRRLSGLCDNTDVQVHGRGETSKTPLKGKDISLGNEAEEVGLNLLLGEVASLEGELSRRSLETPVNSLPSHQPPQEKKLLRSSTGQSTTIDKVKENEAEEVGISLLLGEVASLEGELTRRSLETPVNSLPSHQPPRDKKLLRSPKGEFVSIDKVKAILSTLPVQDPSGGTPPVRTLTVPSDLITETAAYFTLHKFSAQ